MARRGTQHYGRWPVLVALWALAMLSGGRYEGVAAKEMDRPGVQEAVGAPRPRTTTHILITAPADFSVAGPSFSLELEVAACLVCCQCLVGVSVCYFRAQRHMTPLRCTHQIHGGDSMADGSYAAILLNNNHGASVPINTSLSVQTAKMSLQDMRQMVYDVTVALFGPSGKYVGVYNLTTVGVVRAGGSHGLADEKAGADEPEEDPGGQARKWTEDEVREKLKRLRLIDIEIR